jgi:type 2 lantibiotic biosynthesis protein LanM
MKSSELTEIAGGASSLDERIRVTERLGARPAGEVLDAFETWKIDRMAGKLADKFRQESVHRNAGPRYTKQRLVEILTSYRLHSAVADEAITELLGDLHREWLPTYRAALEALDEPSAAASAAEDVGWREFDTYYGRLAIVCQPFLLELGRRLDAACAAQSGHNGVRFARQLVADVQAHLLDRFELAATWAVEAAANVHCAEAGIDANIAIQDDFVDYLTETFVDSAAYHRFYLRFPVLGRWLAHITSLLSDYGRDLVERLAADTGEISRELFGRQIIAYRSVRLGNSDYHAGAQSVAMVDVDLADGSVGTLVYKPRCIAAESAMQRLLSTMRGDGVLDFATRRVLAKDGYGYEELIPSGHNRMESVAEVEQVYRELGGFLALFYVFGGGDLHFENILVADGHAHVCDCETVLGVLPAGQSKDRAAGTLLDSVFKTGLLEWPRLATADARPEMKISGYAGGEGYEMPTPVPRVNEHRVSFKVAVGYEEGVYVEPSAANRVYLGDRLVQPQEQTRSIMDGFDRVYAWFERDGANAVDVISRLFAGSSFRFINWGTQIYSQLLISARHPKCLIEPLEVDLLANTVRTFPRAWDDGGVLAERELESMWRQDVPIFSADADGTHLTHDHRTALASTLESSPLGSAAERIGGLSEQNRTQQRRYIEASLSTGEVASPAFAATSTDYARRIGYRLCQMQREPSAAAPWTASELADGGGLRKVDVDGDLYHGSAGIALFLGYLDHLAPEPQFRAAAQRAVRHAVGHHDHTRIGAFSGVSGSIYVLTHLYHLWGEQWLLDEAIRLAARLPALIDADTQFDVLGGVAGAIPVLLGLAEQSGHGLDVAEKCAQHLLRGAEADHGTLSWPTMNPGEAVANPTGLAHGAAGVGWALITLGVRVDREDYVAAGRRAFAYESRYFDESEQDWYDLRTSAGGNLRYGRNFANAWCNGGSGIGLSRIDSWARLGKNDEDLLRESHQALAATLRNFHRLGNDTLCHGRSGNAELLLRFGLLKDEPAFRLEAGVQVQTLWRNFEDAEHGIAENNANFFPGLMLGISGFGMHFLRLADPGTVPSVLLLDPPTTSAMKEE